LIQKAGKTDDTLVMFLSDNGAAPDGGVAPTTGGFGFTPNLPNDRWRKDGVPIRPGSGPDNLPGPHDTFAAYGLAWANVSNTPLRGTKLTGYEGGIRTPLVVRWPAVVRDRGGLTDQVGHVIDIMATCLDVAGEEYPMEFQGRRPVPMEGRSLLPVFQGRARGHRCCAGAYRSITSSGWGGGKPCALEAVERGNSTISKRMAPRPSIWQPAARADGRTRCSV
jgi:arylsulfatase A-like enzyme